MTEENTWPEHLTDLVPEGRMLKDQYEITGFIGEGGFGAVFKGVQHPLERPVAIKVMYPGHSALVRERFLLEAKAIAGLVHPNVVTVFDYGLIDQRRPFIVMEFLTGDDLGATLRKHGPMPVERALPLFMGVLEALCEAHEVGLVHRDIKPDNLHLTVLPRGREVLRVLDFGIARLTDVDKAPRGSQGPRLTPTGQKLGTPHYLSPEYLESGVVTPAMDVYAMGLVLNELLSGEPSVEAHNFYGYVIRHIRGDLNLSADLLASPLGPVLRRATACDPAQRYPDAKAFLEGLEEALAGQPEAPVMAAPVIVSDAFELSSSAAAMLADAHEPTLLIPDDFVMVSPGRFLMGSPLREPGRNVDERQHVVTITRGFVMQKTPVTQAMWTSLMAHNPAHFQGDRLPVEQVNWYEALAYCNALSEREGLEPAYRFVGVRGVPGKGFVCKKVVFEGLLTEGYRLPTEAEWEFAARAGSLNAREGRPADIAWYDNNSRRRTRPVGTLMANAWGVHDLLGNVWEWCWDRYEEEPPEESYDPTGAADGTTRVFRGGCFSSAARLCRVANRGHSLPHRRLKSIGFRVVRSHALI